MAVTDRWSRAQCAPLSRRRSPSLCPLQLFRPLAPCSAVVEWSASRFPLHRDAPCASNLRAAARTTVHYSPQPPASAGLPAGPCRCLLAGMPCRAGKCASGCPPLRPLVQLVPEGRCAHGAQRPAPPAPPPPCSVHPPGRATCSGCRQPPTSGPWSMAQPGLAAGRMCARQGGARAPAAHCHGRWATGGRRAPQTGGWGGAYVSIRPAPRGGLHRRWPLELHKPSRTRANSDSQPPSGRGRAALASALRRRT